MLIAIWACAAFAAGMLARQVGLPPLVGFLAAGFGLSAAGFEADAVLHEVSEVGVVLLLFTVGLKLRLQSLLRTEVWGTALAHLAILGGLVALLLAQLAELGNEQVLILAAAVAFSSTVLAAKMLESRRELRAFHGRLAIGILIIQDVVAVALLASSAGHNVSPMALLVFGVVLLRPLLLRFLDSIGRDELLVLYGIALALGGGYGFEQLGLSPELGALVLGTLLADHRKAVELSDVLWGLKEFMIVGFFLTIGLTGLPTLEMLGIAAALVVLLPVKGALFFGLLLLFGLRARTAFLAGLSLATFSEFGLIVIAETVEAGILDEYWLVTAALAVSISFALAAPLNRLSHGLYKGFAERLESLETRRRHPDDQPVSLGSAEVVVVGMGRIGTAAYDFVHGAGIAVAGVENDFGKLQSHLAEGRKVVFADADDPGFWNRLNFERVRAIMLALPEVESKIIAAEQLRAAGFQGLISTTHAHPDECERIVAAGADVAYNNFQEAGVGFASHTCQAMVDGV
jgi:predicted Kef-type K+ transport protein